MKVLVVDDEEGICSLIERVLRGQGMQCATEADPQSALRQLTEERREFFDLILLDVVMPGLSGWEFMARIRQAGNDTPVIFLTGRDTVEERVKGLRLGADDYIVKPFEPSELLARVEAVIRRRESMPRIEAGDLCMDLGRRLVTRGGERIDLSPGEFELLRTLVQARGATVSRAELLKKVWGMDFDPGTKVVEVQVARLRKKIDRGGAPLIETRVGEGYRIPVPD